MSSLRRVTLLPILASAALSSCSGGSGSDGDVIVRGLLDAQLPSGAIPSAAIPSQAVPSRVLPSSGPIDAVELTLEAEQVPGGSAANSNVMGTATLNLDAITGGLTGSVTVAGLSASDVVTDVALEIGFAGLGGTSLSSLVQRPLEPQTFDLPGGVLVDPSAFQAGELFLNISSMDFPLGAARGQIVPDGTQVVRVELTEDQVVGADPVAGGGGVVFFTFDETNGLGSGATPSGTGGNDGNAMANNPVVVAETSFSAETLQVVVGGGFAGLEGAANRIILSDTGSGMNFVANGSGTPEAELQSIAGLGGLLNGVYFVEAIDVSGAEVRGQITPRDIQVVRIALTEDQVIGADPVDGGSGVVFFTFDESNSLGSGATPAGTGANDGNAMANNPVVVAETSFPAAAVQVVVGGGFAGLEGAANRIVLSDTGSGMNFVANGPGTPEAELQSIAGLGGLQNGVYFVEAIDPSGAEVRGQIAPRGVQVVRIELTEDQVIGADPVAGGSGVVFFTFDEENGIGSGAAPAGTGVNDGNAMANNPVIVAETSFPANAVQVVVGGGFAGLEGAANRIVLSDTGSGMSFIANGPGTPEAE
ncbi:MAG: CHRD domain-containing protein, partial [Planctomycetota bacterium]